MALFAQIAFRLGARLYVVIVVAALALAVLSPRPPESRLLRACREVTLGAPIEDARRALLATGAAERVVDDEHRFVKERARVREVCALAVDDDGHVWKVRYQRTDAPAP
jgi:hypothetical protein